MTDVNTFEFWLDVSVAGEPACTFFGRIRMPVRPFAGERILFHQDKGSALEFQAEWPGVGWRRCSSVSVEVEEVSHYASRVGEDLKVVSVVRAVSINVRALEDAAVVREILTGQIGFELDSYGINTLDDPQGGKA